MNWRLPFEKELLLISALLSLMVRLWVAWQPVDELTWRATADDAYYYFKLAQHLGIGSGATFDGIHPTNGFHPLYALLLVPIFQYVGDDIALGVHLALTLVALISVVTAWPIYLIGKHAHSSLAGAIGALIHLINPWVIVLTMTGVESAVYVGCFAWTVMAYMRWRSSLQSIPGIVSVGLLAGLTIMARSEGILLLVGIVLDLLIRKKTLRYAITCAILVGGSAFLVCLPWIFWSISLFGTPLQISSSAITLHNYANMPENIYDWVKWYIGRIFWFIPRYLYKIVLFNFLIVIFLVLFYIFRVKPDFSPVKKYYFLIFSFIAVSIYYNMILLHQQHWYFNALVLIVNLVASPVMSSGLMYITSVHALKKYLRFFFVLALGVSSVLFVLNWQRGLYPGQRFAYENGIHIAHSHLREERLGATDSGIIGFFCGCFMANLDGVMNNSAVEYYRVHGYNWDNILEFAVDQNVAYIFGNKPLDSGKVRTVRRVQFPHGVWYQIERTEHPVIRSRTPVLSIMERESISSLGSGSVQQVILRRVRRSTPDTPLNTVPFPSVGSTQPQQCGILYPEAR